MADEGVVQTTWAEAKAHPFWIVGGVVGLVAVFWLFSSGKTAKPQSFNFSLGPSDAQLKAGTDLAISQGQNTTNLALAGIQATSQAATAQDYFGYLSTNSANQLNATSQAISATRFATATAAKTAAGAQAVQIAGIDAAAGTAAGAQGVSLAGIASATKLGLAGTASQTALGLSATASQTALGLGSQSLSLATLSSNERVQADQIATSANVSLTQIGSAERVAAAKQTYNYLLGLST